MSKFIPFALSATLAAFLLPATANAANAKEQYQAMKNLNAKFSLCAAISSTEHSYNPVPKHEQSYAFFHRAALLMGENTSIDSSETEMTIQKAALSMNQIRELSPERFAIALKNCDALADAFVPKR